MYELQDQIFMGRCTVVDQRVVFDVSKYHISFIMRVTYSKVDLHYDPSPNEEASHPEKLEKHQYRFDNLNSHSLEVFFLEIMP